MITPEQRAARRTHIGSSDAAAILGLDPFRNATRVYWDKVGPPIPDVSNNSFQAGNLLEETICAYASDRLKVQLERHVSRAHPTLPLAANFDALVVGDETQAIEAKHSAAYSPIAGEWGDEGTDQIPQHVIIQCQHQMAVLPTLIRVWVPALILDRGSAEFRLYSVDRHAEIIAMLEDKLTAWWNTYVVPGIPPDGVNVPPIEALKALHREPAKTIALPIDAISAVDRLELAKDAVKKAEAEKEAAYAAVVAMLDDAEAGMLPDGRTATYLSQRGSPKVDSAQLRACHPEIYSSFFSDTSHRVLRIKKGK